MNHTKQEPAYARGAWVLLLIVSLLALWIGVGDFSKAADADPDLIESLSGMTWPTLQAQSPQIANLVQLLSRLVGALWIGLASLAAIVSATGFRKGNRWAWFGLWALPLVMALIFITFRAADLADGAPTPPAVYSAPALFILAALGLLLPVRKFFGSDKADTGQAS